MNCKSVAQSQKKEPHQYQTRMGPFKIEKMLRLDVEQYEMTGQWDLLQNARFAAFISLNSIAMRGKPYNKLWKQFKRMSKFIRTRNFVQCKSHHLKLFKQYENIEEVLSYFMFKYPRFQQVLDNTQRQLEQLAAHLGIKCITKIQKKIQNPIIPTPLKTNKQLPDTGVSYEEGEQQQLLNMMELEQNSANIMFQMGPIENTFVSQTSLHFQRHFLNTSREAQWLQCHQLFLKWLNKLNMLIANER